jgi:hypothetical protein
MHNAKNKALTLPSGLYFFLEDKVCPPFDGVLYLLILDWF